MSKPNFTDTLIVLLCVLALLVTPVTLAATNTATSNIVSSSSSHFGMEITGKPSTEVIRLQAQQLGVRDYFTYEPEVNPVITGVKQIFMIKMGSNNAWHYQFWQAYFKTPAAKGLHNSVWLMGNEPNNPSQDNQSPADYATQLHDITSYIKEQVDPTAKFIGPNILNFDATCTGCAGFTSGKAWLADMVSSYISLYQTLPPLDAYSLHTYTIDWQHLPMINAAQDEAQITGLRTWLNQNYHLSYKPIWPEFGIIWSYEGYAFSSDGQIIATGADRRDLLQSYLGQMLGFVTKNANTLNLEKWFVYTNFGQPEPYTNVFTGISLFTSNGLDTKLNDLGHIFKKWRGYYPSL